MFRLISVTPVEQDGSAEGYSSPGCAVRVVIAIGDLGKEKEQLGCGNDIHKATLQALEVATGKDLENVPVRKDLVAYANACIDAANVSNLVEAG